MNLLKTMTFGFLVCTSATCRAQLPETFEQKGYTLHFINQDSTLSPTTKERFIQTFFQVYPLLAEKYNTNTVKEVIFVVDTTYDGVAYAAGGEVHFSDNWLRDHPGDLDVVTHEVMHLVQNYPGEAGPGWLTEGIADYVRYVYGVDNAGGGWFLQPFHPGQSYENGYGVTARFLVWLEKQTKPGIVKTLDQAMRTKTYTDDAWRNQTGKTLDELWALYARNPVI